MKCWEVPWRGASIESDVGMLSELLDALGTPSFGARLYELINEQLPIEILTCSSIGLHEGISVRWLETKEAKLPQETLPQRQLFERYVKTYFREDPLWKQLIRFWRLPVDSDPTILLHRMQVHELKIPQWRNGYESHNITERVVMGAMHPRFGALALGFFCSGKLGEFSPSDLSWLSGMAPLLLRLLMRHEGVRHDSSKAFSDLTAVEMRFERIRGRLTRREVQVCSRLLMGASFEEIGDALGIKHATVKTFRDRAFEKLGISSRFELFALLL